MAPRGHGWRAAPSLSSMGSMNSWSGQRAETFVVSAARGYGGKGDVHLSQAGKGRAAFLERRGRRLAAAWVDAQPFVLGVGEKARAAMALDTPRLKVGYLDTGQGLLPGASGTPRRGHRGALTNTRGLSDCTVRAELPMEA